MKLLGFVSVFMYFILVAEITFGLCEIDGEPGCNLEIELNRPWRNHCEPTKYWTCLCLAKSCSAESVSCPSGKGFMDSENFGLFGCVPWEKYVWTKPYNPPSLP